MCCPFILKVQDNLFIRQIFTEHLTPCQAVRIHHQGIEQRIPHSLFCWHLDSGGDKSSFNQPAGIWSTSTMSQTLL